MSSSSAFVSDRLGSLSYHKPDHPTLNAAAALSAHLNTANCRAAARAPSVQTRPFECRPCYFPLLSDDGHKSRYGRRGVTCAAVLLVRLAPPVPRASPRYAGGRKHFLAKVVYFFLHSAIYIAQTRSKAALAYCGCAQRGAGCGLRCGCLWGFLRGACACGWCRGVATGVWFLFYTTCIVCIRVVCIRV